MDIQTLKNKLLEYNNARLSEVFTEDTITESAKSFSDNEIFFFIDEIYSFTTEGEARFIEPILFITNEQILFFSISKNQVLGVYSSKNITKVSFNKNINEFKFQCKQPGYKQHFKLKTTRNIDQVKLVLKNHFNCNIPREHSSNEHSKKTNSGPIVAASIFGLFFLFILGLIGSSLDHSSLTTSTTTISSVNSGEWLKKIEKKAIQVSPISVNGELTQINILVKYYSLKMYVIDLNYILEQIQKNPDFKGTISISAETEFIDIYGKSFKKNVLKADFSSNDIREINFRNIQLTPMVLAHALNIQYDQSIRNDVIKYCLTEENYRFAKLLCM